MSHTHRISHMFLSVTAGLVLAVAFFSAQAGAGVLYAAPNGLTSGNCDTWANACTNKGGGLYNVYFTNPILTNVIFSNNFAEIGGGGIHNKDFSHPSLTNVTLSGNSASNGGGIFNENNSNPILINNIKWGNVAINSGPQIYNDSSFPIFSFSDVQNSGGSGTEWNLNLGTDGGGNIDADPLFVDSMNGNLHLSLSSPVIDAGNTFSITIMTDLDGNPRFVNNPFVSDTGIGTPPIVDMGAYEVQVNVVSIYLSMVWRDTP